MAVKVVIDTSIWVSSLLNPFGFSAKLRKAFEEGEKGRKRDRLLFYHDKPLSILGISHSILSIK